MRGKCCQKQKLKIDYSEQEGENMDENKIYLDFQNEDDVLTEFVNGRNNGIVKSEKGKRLGILSHVKICGVKKTVINNFNFENKQYIITSYMEQDGKRIVEIYNFDSEKLKIVEEDDKIYKLIQKILKGREEQLRQMLSKESEIEL